MARWSPLKADVLDALAAEILHNYGKGRVIVAVDGLEGSGTAAFADELAEALKRVGHAAFRASAESFRRPRVLHYAAGSDMPSGQALDLDTLIRVLIDPFRDGGTGSFVLQAFDPVRDAPVLPKWITGKPDSILVFDGAFLQSPELRGLWNYTIWVEVPEATSPADEDVAKAQAHYLRQSKPQARASAIIDNSDPEHPRRKFADSC